MAMSFEFRPRPTSGHHSLVHPLVRTPEPRRQLGDLSSAAGDRQACPPWVAQASPRTAPRQRAATEGTDQGGINIKEKHKIFDEASLVVRSGSGGDGEIVEAGKGRMVRNFKYRAGGNMPKQIWLPASDPDDGTDGADVLFVVDPHVDDLLHIHAKRKWAAPKGANGDPAQGSGGPKRRDRSQKKAPPLKISVPPGTVVKDKKGRVLAELVNIGDTFCAAQGGRGGRGVVAPSKEGKARARAKQQRRQQREDDSYETIEVEDVNWKEDAKGAPGEEVKLKLILRVVADVGLVGLPNVGKSSLLKCMTQAKPEVANYPFTTLMPNLGVMQVGGDRELAIGGSKVVLADMPGLIEGAHEGRGLGRMFLRHLGRTKMLVHVVDAASENPAADYWVVREELRMYAPLYCQRPHIVALNKMDLPDAHELKNELVHEVWAMAANLQKDHPEIHIPPVAVHCCSAQTQDGLSELMQSIGSVLEVDDSDEVDDEALDDFDDDDVVDWDTSLPDGDEEELPSGAVGKAVTQDLEGEAAWGTSVHQADLKQDAWLTKNEHHEKDGSRD